VKIVLGFAFLVVFSLIWQLKKLQINLAVAEERMRHLAELEKALEKREEELKRLRKEAAASEEKLALLETAHEQLALRFQSLSAEALQKNSESFIQLAKATFEKFHEGAKGELEKRQNSFGQLVTPVKESLFKLDEGLRKLEVERKGEQEVLKSHLQAMVQTEKDLKKETTTLIQSLRTPLSRGRWGEIQLRRVVELAGMVNQCDFFEQEVLEEGKLRPDLIVRLPGGRQVVIDAKVPLEAYLDAIETKDEAVREDRFKEHARAVRGHVVALSRKAYWESIHPTPEFVVLFLASESFFSAALQFDPSLIEVGAEKGVVISTPTTLIALLRSIAYGWKQENLSRHAEKVSRLGHDLYKRIIDMSSHFSRMGRGLASAVDSYNRGIGSLETRVLPTARKFQELGAASSHLELEPLEVIEKIPRLLQSEEFSSGNSRKEEKEKAKIL